MKRKEPVSELSTKTDTTIHDDSKRATHNHDDTQECTLIKPATHNHDDTQECTLIKPATHNNT